jgi:hypothetical protein
LSGSRRGLLRGEHAHVPMSHQASTKKHDTERGLHANSRRGFLLQCTLRLPRLAFGAVNCRKEFADPPESPKLVLGLDAPIRKRRARPSSVYRSNGSVVRVRHSILCHGR